jgi:hypothetical protein
MGSGDALFFQHAHLMRPDVGILWGVPGLNHVGTRLCMVGLIFGRALA